MDRQELEAEMAVPPLLIGQYSPGLSFEQTIFNLLPTAALILLSPFYLNHYYGYPVRVLSGPVLWAKLITAVTLATLEIRSIRALMSITASAMDGGLVPPAASCVASLCIIFIVNAEHRRALQSSALTGIYLLITLLSDVARAKTFFYEAPTENETLCRLAVGAALLKLFLLALLEIPKGWQLADLDLRQNISDEAVSGFWNRSFVTWAYSTLFLGFRSLIEIGDLGVLSPEFSSQTLSARLELTLQRGNKRSRYYLARALLSCFSAEFLLAVPPKLCLTVFTFCQPLLLYYIITHVSQEENSKLASLALLGVSALIFFSIAAGRSIYNHVNSRLSTMMRGAIIPLIVKKTLLLSKPTVNESAALTLMSSDLEAITKGIQALHDMWGCCIQVGIGIYLLRLFLNEAVFDVSIIIAGGSVLILCADAVYSRYSAAWNKRIEKRVSQTVKAFSQMKSIKTIGVDNAISKHLQKLRALELASFRAMRAAGASKTVITTSTCTCLYAAALGHLLFQIPHPVTFVPAKVFTLLTIATLTSQPLADFNLKRTNLRSAFSSAKRVQVYLLLHHRQTISDSTVENDVSVFSPRPEAAEPETAGRNIDLVGAYIAPSANAEPILYNVWCSLNRSQITAILGPTGSGKSTLLRTFLGEALVCIGQIFRRACQVAYCGQEVWLRDIAIRANIIGSSPFDPVMYEVVTNACGLNVDFQQLPNGDLFVVGINGAKLSEGQKQRIALARALYERAKIILLDDIFSGLDSTTAQDIHNRLFGPKGVLRNSAATVVFVTRCASFIKVADQALILDGSGTITVEAAPSKLNLSSGFVAQLDRDAPSQDIAMQESQSIHATAAYSSYLLEDDIVRQRGDRSLYWYFLGPTSSWKIAFLFLITIAIVASDHFSDVFVKIWLETDSGVGSLDTYIKICASTSLFAFITLCLWFVVVMPQNSLMLHERLLNSVFSTALSHFHSMDMGSLMRLFGDDMTQLTDRVPRALYRMIYWGSDVLLSTYLIVSGINYPVSILFFLVLILNVIVAFFLRTSRQLRYLDTEASTPLHTILTEVASGIEHIRAFGWEQSLNDEVIRALDSAQKPYYYKLAIQRWIELAVDVVNLGLILVLVHLITSIQERVNQAAVGLSLLNLVTYGDKLNTLVDVLVELETSFAGVARLRAFIHGTPAEEVGQETLAPQWPASGHVVFSDVTAQYSASDRVPVLSSMNLAIYPGQKVGISGRSGGGKTSLLMTMLRLTEYTGTITIDGVDISTISSNELRSRITTVSQDTVKLNGTVRENLLPYEGQINDKTITDVIIAEATDQVDMTDAIELRGGLDLSLSQMGFSQGQMQLLSLARAIIHHTCTQSRVVLLDEPTSTLDPETDDRIQSVIRDEFLDCTIFIISHREDSLWDSDVRLEVSGKRVHRIAAPKHPPKRLAHLF